MTQYELSIDPALVAEADRLVSLEGRTFPTLVVQWESSILGQSWLTTLVLDYTIPLPPLRPGTTFNEVRIGAYTGEVPTKFLYLGTELSADAPRVPPEMENVVSPAGHYQEYRLDERTCAVAYLDLITTTPRIYGNGPQDYYSPPIKVERFDAAIGPELIADNFPKIVADLPPISGEILTGPSQGFWRGGRFVGTKKIAILRKGKVVGLCHRAGRPDKEVVPPEVVRRDPHSDVRDVWVAFDIGMMGTVVAVGTTEQTELVRLGASDEPTVPADYENPCEIAFNNLPRVLKAWRDRVILPLTEWGDLWVGHAARARRRVHGKERAQRTKAAVAELGALPARMAAGEAVHICGRSDLDNTMKLEPPPPPIIDEEGIDPDDPFDPLELYAYYVGLHVNARDRGLHLRYAVGMPTGWADDLRQQVLASVRRGLLRSLPAGMVAFDDLDLLQVIDAGPNVLSFAAFAFRVFGVQPKGEPVPFVAIDAGASETSVLCGSYREGSPDEVAAGLRRVIEHVDPTVLRDLGGELLLHRMAYKVYAASSTSMRHNEIVFVPPGGEEPVAGCESLMVSTPDAQVNVRLLKDAVRTILETTVPQPMPDLVQLFAADGRVRDVRIMIDRAVLGEWLRGQLSEAAVAIQEAIGQGFQQISRQPPNFADLRVLLGGRLGMHPFLQERLQAVLPQGVRLHRFKEPDHTNLAAPTVKLATALGILTLRYQQMGPTAVSDDRATFRWVVGRARRGALLSVLDSSVGYDIWRELGACTRPEVSVLYASAEPGAESLAADDPRVQRAACELGYDAVGYRVYVRAVGGTRVEVSFGPPGGRPDDDAACWEVDLEHGTARPVAS
ncbi:MAG: hypothetical protein JRI23_23685 [Deltaproteobacteria bacterium]|jgi:hypothetical protein|nr:hypothetical protein [Deltaproteobacteria bacterium]MBW2534995.1 hypothetical protein [Deltaproteobacteria bacterium]